MTLRELSAQYERSAQLLRVRISELRRRKKMTQDAQELFWLERRMAALAPMLRQMNELAELTAHYYERGYDRNEGYRVGGLSGSAPDAAGAAGAHAPRD